MSEHKQFKNIKLDKINIGIFKSLIEKGNINYSAIGKDFGVSHVTIKNRYEKLLQNKLIRPCIQVNFSKLDFKLAIILLEIESENLLKIENIYSVCPRVLFNFSIIGEYNYFILIYAENLGTIETISNSCMLYSLKGVRKSNILILRNLKQDFFLPLKISKFAQKKENAPCGICCKFCEAFIEEKCVGCLASKYYNGPLQLM